MIRNIWKRTFGPILLAKIQISLCIQAVWSESSLTAIWIVKGALADLSLRYGYMSECMFSHLANYILIFTFSAHLQKKKNTHTHKKKQNKNTPYSKLYGRDVVHTWMNTSTHAMSHDHCMMSK